MRILLISVLTVFAQKTRSIVLAHDLVYDPERSDLDDDDSEKFKIDENDDFKQFKQDQYIHRPSELLQPVANGRDKYKVVLLKCRIFGWNKVI